MAIIGGVFCGQEISPGLYAEAVASGRWVVRKKVSPTCAQRLGEVMGGNQRFQIMTMSGARLGAVRSLKLAVEQLNFIV